MAPACSPSGSPNRSRSTRFSPPSRFRSTSRRLRRAGVAPCANIGSSGLICLPMMRILSHSPGAAWPRVSCELAGRLQERILVTPDEVDLEQLELEVAPLPARARCAMRTRSAAWSYRPYAMWKSASASGSPWSRLIGGLGAQRVIGALAAHRLTRLLRAHRFHADLELGLDVLAALLDQERLVHRLGGSQRRGHRLSFDARFARDAAATTAAAARRVGELAEVAEVRLLAAPRERKQDQAEHQQGGAGVVPVREQPIDPGRFRRRLRHRYRRRLLHRRRCGFRLDSRCGLFDRGLSRVGGGCFRANHFRLGWRGFRHGRHGRLLAHLPLQIGKLLILELDHAPRIVQLRLQLAHAIPQLLRFGRCSGRRRRCAFSALGRSYEPQASFARRAVVGRNAAARAPLRILAAYFGIRFAAVDGFQLGIARHAQDGAGTQLIDVALEGVGIGAIQRHHHAVDAARRAWREAAGDLPQRVVAANRVARSIDDCRRGCSGPADTARAPPRAALIRWAAALGHCAPPPSRPLVARTPVRSWSVPPPACRWADPSARCTRAATGRATSSPPRESSRRAR